MAGSLRDIHNLIKQKVTENLSSTVGKKVQEVLKQYTDELLYQAQTPNTYQRTYELLNSITVDSVTKTGLNTFQIRVFFDSSKIHPYETAPGQWNQHMSTDGYNTDESKNVPYYMEYGHGGLYHQKPLGFTEASKEYLEQTKAHIKELQKRLLAIGIDCTFK